MHRRITTIKRPVFFFHILETLGGAFEQFFLAPGRGELKRLKPASPARFFLWVAPVIFLLFNLATPPLQAPDEFSHLYRAYQVSEGHLLPVKEQNRLGGYMPAGLIDFMEEYKQPAYIFNYTLRYQDIRNSFKIDLAAEERKFQDFANTAYYSPVSYLPQAAALFVLRQFNCPPALLYYGGRIFVFLIWLFCMYRVIQMLPVFKWLFCALLLLPMHGYIANSFSADTVTNILSFLFIAHTLKHIFVSKRITGRHLLVLALLLVLLALAKVVYVGLVVLLFAIPAYKFNNKTQRFLALGGLFLLSATLAGLWSQAVMKLYIPFKDYNPAYRDVACLSPCGDYYAQQQYIASHGLYFFRVIWHSLTDHPATYLRGYAGVFGNGDIGLPGWIYGAVYSLILLLALTEKNEFRLTRTQKVLFLVAAMAAFVLLILSQHLIWDCVGEGVVDMVQGRYLIPLFPLLLLPLSTTYLQFRLSPGWLVLICIVLLNVYSSFVIYQRFFVGPKAEKTELFCDAEEVDAYGGFKTTGQDAWFQGAASRSRSQQRSGTFSAELSPASPFCFTYKFGGLRRGDLVEVEAWQKGSGALLVVAGKAAACSDFYFANTLKSYSDGDGWQRIRNVCPVAWDCDGAEMAVYAWNPGKEPVYLDDIRLKVTRFAKQEQ